METYLAKTGVLELKNKMIEIADFILFLFEISALAYYNNFAW
jgi:hypothetical protein